MGGRRTSRMQTDYQLAVRQTKNYKNPWPKLYLRIQSVPQRKHISPFQRLSG
jgi:hypothetical protein